MPLSFDETFRPYIATQPDLAGLLRWCLHEIAGPGYYGPLWLWVRLQGQATGALRLPSLLFSIATPLMMLR